MGFGLLFRSWISLIYSAQSTEIFLEGFRSSIIMIHRGVRQGCPFSPVLFNIIIEPLAIAVRATEAIMGLRTPTRTHKLMLYADFFFTVRSCQLNGSIRKPVGPFCLGFRV